MALLWFLPLTEQELQNRLLTYRERYSTSDIASRSSWRT
jgi:hypothetical protein